MPRRKRREKTRKRERERERENNCPHSTVGSRVKVCKKIRGRPFQSLLWSQRGKSVKDLQLAYLLDKVDVVLLHARGVVDQVPRRLDLRGHVGDLVLQTLQRITRR